MLTPHRMKKIIPRPSQRLRLRRVRPGRRRPRSDRQHGPGRAVRPRDQSQPSETTEAGGREAGKQDRCLGAGKPFVVLCTTSDTLNQNVVTFVERFADFVEQEDYASKHNVSEEDKMAVADGANKPVDPMQGLEGLDEAGPKLT